MTGPLELSNRQPMQVIDPGKKTDNKRRKFFDTVYNGQSGYVCIATINQKKEYAEKFFKYPDQLPEILDFINTKYATRNIYFCPQLLRRKRRAKEVVETCTVAWADLDECDPSLVAPEPSIVLRTSANRYQAYWLLDSPTNPVDAEDASRRVAYKHEAFGVDRSGWDLTQLLRVPYTYNLKREDQFVIEITKFDNKHPLSLNEFKKLPQVPGYEFIDIPFPEALLHMGPDRIFEKYKGRLNSDIIELFNTEPKHDWSANLWLLERTLFEHGLTREEVFVVCHNAKCNKYERDNRPPQALWRDVCKAATEEDLPTPIMSLPPAALLTAEERKEIAGYESFVERYIDWAQQQTDASPEYHVAGAFTILSALLSGAVKTNTSYGTVVPNLWFLCMGDTTLARKSTALSIAMELLLEINEDVLLATDGSVEGLISAISTRPGKPGVFWRDEFSGFLESMTKRDYLAGMSETLTKLYDGTPQKRVLRKETITLINPIMIILAGGIRGRIHELFSTDHILSGFVPRFVFVHGVTDMSRIRPLGPRMDESTEARDALVAELSSLDERYNTPITARIGSQIVEAPGDYEAVLTPEAWERHNAFLNQMYEFAMGSSNVTLYMPTMDRLAMSGLKAAILLAASRQNPEDDGKITVEKTDILRAINYVEKWRDYSVEVVNNAGKTGIEKRIDYIYKMITDSKDGIKRSALMQRAWLTARDADWVLETLEQRGVIKRVKSGKRGGEVIKPTTTIPPKVNA